MKLERFCSRSPRGWLWLSLVGVGLSLRLWLAVRYYGNYDQTSFEIVADILRHGGNVYAETARYNYTPIWSYVLFVLSYGADWLGLPFHVAVRGFLTGIDLVNMLLIGRIAAYTTAGYARLPAIRYWLNPVAILLVGFHGQFENLAALPLLLALALYTRPSGQPRTRWLWLLGTLAILIKHNTVFGVWMLFVYLVGSWRRASLLLLLSLGVFLATFVPYLSTGFLGIVINVALYRSTILYGLGLLLPPALSMLLFAGGMFMLPTLAKRFLSLGLPQAVGFSFVGLLTLTFGIGNQYYILPVIFNSLSGGTWYWIYSLSTTLLLLSNHNNLAVLTLPPLYNLVWLVTLGWFLSYFVPCINNMARRGRQLLKAKMPANK